MPCHTSVFGNWISATNHVIHLWGIVRHQIILQRPKKRYSWNCPVIPSSFGEISWFSLISSQSWVSAGRVGWNCAVIPRVGLDVVKSCLQWFQIRWCRTQELDLNFDKLQTAKGYLFWLKNGSFGKFSWFSLFSSQSWVSAGRVGWNCPVISHVGLDVVKSCVQWFQIR